MPKPPETVHRPADPAHRSPVPQPATHLLARVLIAASDPDLRLYVRVGLEGMVDEMVEAADGLEALQRMAGRRVDLVIADAYMPRLDGAELARVMTVRGVPVLLLDGVSRAEVPGAAVLEKPFDRRQLREAIAEAVAL